MDGDAGQEGICGTGPKFRFSNGTCIIEDCLRYRTATATAQLQRPRVLLPGFRWKRRAGIGIMSPNWIWTIQDLQCGSPTAIRGIPMRRNLIVALAATVFCTPSQAWKGPAQAIASGSLPADTPRTTPAGTQFIAPAG